jgi:hypothetical protein
VPPIERRYALSGGHCGQALDLLGVVRAHLDPGAADAQAGEHAVLALHHAPDRGGRGQGGDDGLRALCQRARGLGPGGAGRQQIPGRLALEVVDAQRMARPQQIGGERRAHVAQSDETDLHAGSRPDRSFPIRRGWPIPGPDRREKCADGEIPRDFAVQRDGKVCALWG